MPQVPILDVGLLLSIEGIEFECVEKIRETLINPAIK